MIKKTTLIIFALTFSLMQGQQLVTFLNSPEGNAGMNLGGSLELHRQVTGNIFELVQVIPSGTQVLVSLDELYFVRTCHLELGDELEWKHKLWNHFTEEATVTTPIFNFTSEIFLINAQFNLKETIDINVDCTDCIEGDVNLQILDPWFVSNPDEEYPEDWNYPNTFVNAGDSWDVFQNVNINHLDIDFGYTVKAPALYANAHGIYEFTHWSGDLVNFEDENEPETRLYFMHPNAEITAHYTESPVNEIEDYEIYLPETNSNRFGL